MERWNNFLFLMVRTRMSIGTKQATWTHARLVYAINIRTNAPTFASTLIKYLIVGRRKDILNFAMIEILWCFFFFRSRSRKKLNCKIYLIFVNGGDHDDTAFSIWKYSNTQTLCGGLCQTAFIAQSTIVLMQQVEFRCPQSRMSDQTITPETSCPTLYE